MNKKIYGICIMTLLLTSAFVSVNSIVAKNDEILGVNNAVTTGSTTILSDDFDDNSKNYTIWSELHDDGEWFEQNQRCEFQLHELDGTTYSEGIESSSFSVSLGHKTSVIVSADMITDIYHSPGQRVGQLHMRVTDGTDCITASYYRLGNDLCFSDSKGGFTVLNNDVEEGSFNVQIEIRRDEYRVTMNSITSDWIDYKVFSSSANPTLKIQLYMELAGDYPKKYWIAGFDNLVVEDEGRRPVVDFSYEHKGYTVNFDASTLTYDPDKKNIAMYRWDFTDDGIDDAGGAKASHTYTSEGTFDCELWVIDEDGEESWIIHPITVPYPEKKPKFDIEIKDSKGKVDAEISNTGEVDADNVQWGIYVEGIASKGQFRFEDVDLLSNGIVDRISAGDSCIVSSPDDSLSYRVGLVIISASVLIKQPGEFPEGEITEKALALILRDQVIILKSL